MFRRLVAVFAAPVVSLAIYAVAAAAGDDPAAKTQQILSELESRRAAPALSGVAASSSVASDAGVVVYVDAPPSPVTSPLTSPLVAADVPISEARKALDKAKQLRALGDAPRAELEEDVALEWAETARELVDSVESEREADRAGSQAVAATTKAERARQLLEESIARRGRLQAALDTLDKELADKPLDAGSADAKPKKSKGGAK